MRLPRRFGPLHEREFGLLYAGQAVSLLGDALVPVALAFAVLDLTGSPADLGYVFAAQILPLVVFLLAGGVWADRLPRQLVMLGSDVVRGLAQATVAFLLLTDRAELWQLIALAAVYGTAEAFFRPAATGLIPLTVSAPRLQQANALLAMTMNGTNVLGPVLAGALVAVANPGVALAFDAGTFAVSAAFLLQLRPAAVERTAERQSFLHELAGRLGRVPLAYLALDDRPRRLDPALRRRRAVPGARAGDLEGPLRRRRRVVADPRRLRARPGRRAAGSRSAGGPPGRSSSARARTSWSRRRSPCSP